MIRKYKSIEVSERVFDILGDLVDFKNDYEGMLETFNNHREQGFVLSVNKVGDYNLKHNLFVWAFENRSSDDIVIITSKEYPNNGMFDEEAYNNAKRFNYDEYFKACEYIKHEIETKCGVD